MGRTVIIGTLIAFAIFNLLLGLGFYLFLKMRKENGQSLYETHVNQQTRTEKLGLGEITIRTETLFLGFASPHDFASLCLRHCSTCVALAIRGMMI